MPPIPSSLRSWPNRKVEVFDELENELCSIIFFDVEKCGHRGAKLSCTFRVNGLSVVYFIKFIASL